MMHTIALHGFLGAPSAWDEAWRASGLDGVLHAPVLPLHGLPPRHATIGGWDDALDALDAELPTGELLLAGYSLGARLALGLAMRRPERVRGLLLVSGHAGLPEHARAERRSFEQAQAARLDGAASMAAFVDAWETEPVFAGQSEAQRRAQRVMREAHDRQIVAGAFRLLGQSQMPWYEPELARLTRPVRWLAGARDARYRELALRYAASAGEAILVDGGHNLLLDAPAAVGAALSALAEEA